jgi:putative SOS response-associated peptidase YedK
MPVILHPDEYPEWLDRNITDPAGLTHLFQFYPADLMVIWQVFPQVKSEERITRPYRSRCCAVVGATRI